MKTRTLLAAAALALAVAIPQPANAFCGFYVAKADATLFNKSSQVIIVRDGDRTVVTMSSDYEGDAKDFAMVVPVPVVLEESDIRVVQQYVFEKFDAYTAPRLVEYFDQDPCMRRKYESMATTKDSGKGGGGGGPGMNSIREKALGVTVEAKYTVGEYDILLLSALESTGLKTWLTENGYKIPKGADEVLDPYIRDGMKFFVVKVNLEQQKSLGLQTLRPLQIQYNTSKFMLPIRLGMANATGTQDMIVYAFTKRGRVETTNYRTTLLPTNRDIPEFIQTQNLFGDFYKSVYDRAWAREGRNTVMVEYAWNVSGQVGVKCDPCVTSPVTYAELREGGVWWVEPSANGGYTGELFVTRLHVRYGRKTFPQDLQFLNTSDMTNFQGRYVVRHAPKNGLNCPEAEGYKRQLAERRAREMDELVALTGWNRNRWPEYARTGNVPKLPPVAPTPVTPSADTLVPTPEVAPPAEPQLANPTDSLAQSDAFLNKEPESSGLSTRTWLIILAGASLLTGLLVRWFTKRPNYSSDKKNGE